MRSRHSPPVLLAIALPLLLAIAVAALAIGARVRGVEGAGLAGDRPAAAQEVPPETGPLALAPVDAPDAAGPQCAALLEVNGVQWLRIDDAASDPVVSTYIAVDRPVYVVLTVPVDAGSGPLQAVADAVRTTLPATAVAVR